MMRILLASVMALLLFTVAASAENQKKVKKDAEVTFLTSIECPSCVKKLEATLPFEKGVKDMKIDVEKHTIWFLYNPKKTNKLNLAKAIEALGFTAQEIVPENKGQ